MAHDVPPKVKLSGQRRGMMSFRGSTDKKVSALQKELCSTFGDVLMPKSNTFGAEREGAHLGEGQLGLVRTMMCHPTSLFVDVLPMVSAIQDRSLLERECGIGNLCSSLVRESNWYSSKYDKKSFTSSRLEFVQKSMAYNRSAAGSNVMDVDDGGEISDGIEEW